MCISVWLIFLFLVASSITKNHTNLYGNNMQLVANYVQSEQFSLLTRQRWLFKIIWQTCSVQSIREPILFPVYVAGNLLHLYKDSCLIIFTYHLIKGEFAKTQNKHFQHVIMVKLIKV